MSLLTKNIQDLKPPRYQLWGSDTLSVLPITFALIYNLLDSNLVSSGASVLGYEVICSMTLLKSLEKEHIS